MQTLPQHTCDVTWSYFSVRISISRRVFSIKSMSHLRTLSSQSLFYLVLPSLWYLHIVASFVSSHLSVIDFCALTPTAIDLYLCDVELIRHCATWSHLYIYSSHGFVNTESDEIVNISWRRIADCWTLRYLSSGSTKHGKVSRGT